MTKSTKLKRLYNRLANVTDYLKRVKIEAQIKNLEKQ